MTMRDPLRIRELHGYPYRAFEVNGLPVDCVNVGRAAVFPEGLDLVLSGINHGPNLGYDITYSGTVAGAMEGVINGIASFSFSMATFVDGAPLHFDTAERWLTENFDWLLALPKDELAFWNVNIPAIAYEELAGVRVTRMGRRVYEDRVEPRQDPWGRTYYWQGGVTVRRSDDVSTDVGAISQGFVSVTPIRMDWTDVTLLNSAL
jgi:5'-nucleotidase